ncbi:MAG TPA: glutamate synthase subunit beta [Dehalococcoidia bacterium]|nr:glutamate synthase subunit beta [Dehalococcoidia bacterium]MDP7089678.1 glutamate synthase subunit beta [Dehalococcoidia bacterium]MDP7261049.1 glutamate synthase subunit beta [Dehalococcoidia bacterium]MDP7485112.1 glutamate synthase subunit beta [Dehalococcoidia bacterium]HJP28179.1 glutamate synthase subunit beta [Dehalococcoidia bacterium]
MGKVTGFMEAVRRIPLRRDKVTRLEDWKEVYLEWDESDARRQASRCMDCGVPFCNSSCPLGNLIPEFNDFIYHGNWEEAVERLHATNNFPEFTGRICPAPCEASCTLSVNNDPVTIEMIEKQIVEHAWKEGWIKPQPAKLKSGKKVAVIGSGPAGLATAQQLARAGHTVTVYERNEYIGGLLALGIPEFKLEKDVIERRVNQLRGEGLKFRVNTNVGVDVTPEELLADFDAICLSGGSTIPRDLPVEGRDLKGVYFAMEFLTQQNRKLRGQEFPPEENIDVVNKKVIIIGGGDTGADCLGTSHRQGAANIIQMEIMPRPSETREATNPWPQWPTIFRTSSAHEEGGDRDFNVLTKRFVGDDEGNLKLLECARVEWVKDEETGRFNMNEVPGSEFTIEADAVFLAMGFLHPQHNGLLDDLGVDYDPRGNVAADGSLRTNLDKVFACGDMQRGQSLVVHAIASGRRAARQIDIFLTGESRLPTVRGYARPPIMVTVGSNND